MIKNMISLSDSTFFKADQFGKKTILPLLEKNQIVEAKVLQLLSPSKAELLIMGKKVLADTSMALTKGETIQLKVTDQGSLNIFKLMPDRVNQSLSSDPQSVPSTLTPGLPRLSDIALQFLTQQQPFEGFAKLATALFPNLKATLDKAFVKPLQDSAVDKTFGDKADIKNLLISVALKSEKSDIDFLPNLLQKSGILLEKKIADMVKNATTFNKPIGTSSNKFSDNSDIASWTASKSDNPENPLAHAFSSASHEESSATSPYNSDFPGTSSNPLFKPENLVHEDIKGAVLSLLANSGGESFEDIQIFHEFVKNLENVQLLNSHMSESGKYIIPFPLFSENQFSFGQLFIDLGNKEKDGTSSKENSLLRVSIFLDMTNLGPIRADFSVLKNNITGGFQVSNEEIAVFFRQMLPELQRRLQLHDYQVHKIECRVAEPEKLAEQSIINELLKSEDHGFSVMI
ncbi:MAG: flagellar hook-length control protein FliK [Desulfamplus sp.]|nr:flagellar hook-length control protein FliK [Desulfamplus sp.]